MQSSIDTNRAACQAIYRLPNDNVCHAHRCEPLILTDVKAAGSGFIFAPFEAANTLYPTLLFAGEPTTEPVPEAAEPVTPAPANGMTTRDDRQAYAQSFGPLHNMLATGELRKVVLSRRAEVRSSQKLEPIELFARACRAYPQAFVAMVETPNCGTWIMATPELLVDKKGETCHTMALAGTMRPTRNGGRAEWSDKNREEQRVVGQYIAERLSGISRDIEASATETATSAGLAHLRTLFTFHTSASAADVATLLHPTPAVCGMPQAAAMQAIKTHETQSREYYSGFAGPISAGGDARLFVTLRCMKITADGYTLFAGGGLMPGSREEDEWDETEAKMDAMRRLMY